MLLSQEAFFLKAWNKTPLQYRAVYHLLTLLTYLLFCTCMNLYDIPHRILLPHFERASPLRRVSCEFIFQLCPSILSNAAKRRLKTCEFLKQTKKLFTRGITDSFWQTVLLIFYLRHFPLQTYHPDANPHHNKSLHQNDSPTGNISVPRI